MVKEPIIHYSYAPRTGICGERERERIFMISVHILYVLEYSLSSPRVSLPNLAISITPPWQGFLVPQYFHDSNFQSHPSSWFYPEGQTVNSDFVDRDWSYLRIEIFSL